MLTAPGQGSHWPTGCTAGSSTVAGPPGQAGVHPEGGRQAAPARHPRDRRPRACRRGCVNALEPEWEARFEPRSYGFRPGRGCHDAIEAIFTRCQGRRTRPGGGCSTRTWQRRSTGSTTHHLLGQLGTFPARELIADWLKAGVVEHGRFTPTEEGTPQGGVVSPLLLNVALHGMEQAAGVRYQHRRRRRVATCPDSSGADQIRRRPRRAVPHQGRGRTGQGTAGRVAGAQGSGLQRGQDARRPPRRGLRLPRVQRPPLSTASC